MAAAAIMTTTVVFAGSEPQKENNKAPASSSPSVTAVKDNDSENQETLTRREGKAKSIPDYTKYAHSIYPEKYVEGQTWMESVGINDDFENTMECAFLRFMTEDTIEVDPVEYINEDTDQKRRKELGITLKYLRAMDGYYLNNPDKKTLTWKIDENTEYIFLDWGRDFIIEDSSTTGITVKTKDRELFRCYIATYKNSKPGMPFFFEVEDGVVKRVVEKFFA